MTNAESPSTRERGRGRTRLIALFVGLAFVVATITITVLEPTDIQREAPFVTKITALNAIATTRTFKMAVTDARLADRLTSDDWIGTTDGVWLVVDVLFASRAERQGLVGSLSIGGIDYLASARADDAGLNSAFSDPGLPWQKSIVFELPKSALDDAGASNAIVQFATSDDPRLDGVAELNLDLGKLQHPSSIVLSRPGRVAG